MKVHFLLFSASSDFQSIVEEFRSTVKCQRMKYYKNNCPRHNENNSKLKVHLSLFSAPCNLQSKVGGASLNREMSTNEILQIMDSSIKKYIRIIRSIVKVHFSLFSAISNLQSRVAGKIRSTEKCHQMKLYNMLTAAALKTAIELTGK